MMVNHNHLDCRRLANILETLGQKVGSGLHQQQEDFLAKNQNRCNVQERVAKEFTNRRILNLEERISKLQQTGKARVLPALKGQIKAAQDLLQVKLDRIEKKRAFDLTFRDLAAGVITVE